MATFSDQKVNNVVGNNYTADSSAGFKSEVKHVFESYSAQGIDLSKNMGDVIASPSAKEDFIGNVTESLTTSPLFTSSACANSPFYNNYANRVEQLLENSLNTIATEAALIGYAPIVAYNPFFLKKQWIECVFKDVLMTEVPKSPVINLAFEKRYLKTLDGTEYSLPECLYNDATVKTLMSESTGSPLKETGIDVSLCKNLELINSTYIDDAAIVKNDPAVELTPDIHIWKVDVSDGATPTAHTASVNVNIKTDITTHNFIKGKIHYVIYDADGKTVLATIDDELVGNVDFDKGTISVFSTTGKVTKIYLRGKIANRWNNRSIDVVRRVEQLQYVMPESGPHLNSAVTIEDAADALVLQNIDVIADNVDIMGRTLANFEDAEIKTFLDDSYTAQNAAQTGVFGYNANMTVTGTFDALPYDTYARNISDWMRDSREYFERVIAGLKNKLYTSDAIVVAVAHPNVIRFLQDGINWVFTDDTQISGMKISYNFGIYTSAQDRVHVITSYRMNESDGIKFVVIPLTPELVTFKHYKYNTVIDRNYRNPLHTLTPNIMCTQRTLTFEVLPVQGKLNITGTGLFSPTTLKRA
jgi:hypothetical protein